MGLKKYNILNLFEKSPLVTSSSISRRINNGYYKQLIKRMIDKKNIYRVTKGKYSKFNDPSLFVYAVTPAYLGLQDAMSIHDMWSQETSPIIITSRKIRVGVREIMDSNVLIKRIDKKYMFGIGYINLEKYYLPYSDIEKTFIDIVYFNENIDLDTLTKFQKKINVEKLKRYLKKYSKRFQNKCLNRFRKCN